MDRFIRLDKEDFIGRGASLRLKQRAPRIKLVYMEVDAGDNDARGNEPVYKDGKVVGLTTSGGYGFAVKKSVAFAYVAPELAAEGESFEIMMLGEMRKARIIPEPIWDAANERLRA
jgi:dimethylglycine dehydrogenase